MVDQICTYLFQKRGIFYYSRRVPKELQPKVGRQRIIVSLKTKSPTKANSLGQLVTQKLDEEMMRHHVIIMVRQPGRLTLGAYEDWIEFSDHVPIIVDIRV